LPNEVLVLVLRYLPSRDAGCAASVCRRLYALRGEYVWHAALRDFALDQHLVRQLSLAQYPEPRVWPAGLGDEQVIDYFIEWDLKCRITRGRCSRLRGGTVARRYFTVLRAKVR
jgi:hypothetical protein